MTMTNKDYLAACGQICPFCGDHDIEGGPVDVESNFAWQDIKCNACEKTWQDIYTLTGFEET